MDSAVRSAVLNVQHVVDAIGQDIVTIAAAPDGTDIEVSGIEFYDSARSLQADRGIILCLPSAAGLSADALTSVARRAHELGCAAIAVTTSSHTQTYVDVATDAGLALLVLDDSLSWRRFNVAVSAAIAVHGLGERLSVADDSAELSALADSIANVFGGSTTIEDLDRRVVAYSSIPGQLIDPLRTTGILERYVPPSDLGDEQYRRVARAHDECRFPQFRDELARIAIAVNAGGMQLGTIWVIDPSPETALTDDQRHALRSGADLAAYHLIQRRDNDPIDRRRRDSTLRGLLLGIHPGGEGLADLFAAEAAESILVGFSLGPHLPSSVGTHQIRSVVSRHFAPYRAATATAVIDNTAYALVPGSDVAEMCSTAERILRFIGQTVGQLAYAGISAPTGLASEVRQQRTEVDEVLECIAAPNKPAVAAAVSDVRSQVLLSKLTTAIASFPRLADPAIREILLSDRRDNTEYALTLLSWFDNFTHIPATARDLGLHENTVRYRLQRAHELFDIKLETAEQRLTFWLELRAAVTNHRALLMQPDTL
ncbi:helix-turn-helix domain-containing protein [Mycobacterium sp. 21AC1]|uniref:PucR family transcriptional regulator n=1 Tax=[Mycobacterium] appelbergii TaxID=2939269 RepID=UPI0029391252|nr:helix-turn-helix domain-containing protein [Mycobacterium sp. 21AC1]MDV3125980.1 helix-turn-helix domain-containing protein [Mycobacterium sp. 21AC1]